MSLLQGDLILQLEIVKTRYSKLSIWFLLIVFIFNRLCLKKVMIIYINIIKYLKFFVIGYFGTFYAVQ